MKRKTYLLIDCSGSMINGWDETTNAVTAFAGKITGKLHAAAFDGFGGMVYRVLHDGKAKEWKVEYTFQKVIRPRGMTPLYDAVQTLGTYINKDKPKKAQIVIVTDGRENASRENTRDDTMALTKVWEKKGYDIVFLGASFKDVHQQAASVGVPANKTINMSDSSTYVGTLSAVADRNAGYMRSNVSSTDDLDEKIRGAAEGKGDTDAAQG